MAERRMFAKTIIDSDAFLDMPLSAQCLYFHLSMRADDDGFVNNPKKIQRMIGASDDDCRLLALKKFIIAFESGVIVIKHWKIHNYIRTDRYKSTTYIDEKRMLIQDENNAYTLDNSDLDTVGIPNDNQRLTQDRIGTKVEYPEDIIEGCINLVKWDIENRDKVGVQSETLSRHSVTYFNQDASNTLMGYPVALLGFLKPYIKARF